MRVLVADDDRLTRTILVRTLERWGLEVVSSGDGESAWTLIADRGPSIAILDWMMPVLDGVSLCRRIRQSPAVGPLHVILLSSRDSRPDLIAGLEAGADDYLIKPFDLAELKARIGVGIRIVGLQEKLATRVTELEATLAKVRQLQGLLPICSYCKAVRSDQDYWEQIDTYITQHSDAQFSHGVCPDCLERAMNDMDAAASPKRKHRR